MVAEKNPASELAAKRRTHDGLCEKCGQPFTGLTQRRYCSKVCGVMAWQAANPNRVAKSRHRRYRARRNTPPEPHP